MVAVVVVIELSIWWRPHSTCAEILPLLKCDERSCIFLAADFCMILQSFFRIIVGSDTMAWSQDLNTAVFVFSSRHTFLSEIPKTTTHTICKSDAKCNRRKITKMYILFCSRELDAKMAEVVIRKKIEKSHSVCPICVLQLAMVSFTFETWRFKLLVGRTQVSKKNLLKCTSVGDERLPLVPVRGIIRVFLQKTRSKSVNQ